MCFLHSPFSLSSFSVATMMIMDTRVLFSHHNNVDTMLPLTHYSKEGAFSYPIITCKDKALPLSFHPLWCKASSYMLGQRSSPYHSTHYDVRLPPSSSYLSLFFQLFYLGLLVLCHLVSAQRAFWYEGGSIDNHPIIDNDRGAQDVGKRQSLNQ